MKAVIKILKLLLIVFAAIIIVNSFSAVTFKKFSSGNQADPRFAKGIYHVHTLFSDGLGSVEEVASEAKKRNLDFVILTDHGVPNINSFKSSGLKNGTLIIGGSEFSLDSGHMSSAGFSLKNYKFPSEPQAAIDQVKRDNGITFTAHPFDSRIGWHDWNIEDFTGIEIINVYSASKKMGLFSILSFPFEYLLNSEYSILDSLYYPEKNMQKWDEFSRNGQYMGIFALDAHSKLPISRKISLKFPSYKSLFGILNLYVKTGKLPIHNPQKAYKLIISKIREGHYFNVIEAISDANGFDIVFIPDDGNKIYETGDYCKSNRGFIKINLPFKFRTTIILKRDGKIIKRFIKNIKKELKIIVRKSGVYRSEVYLSDSRFKKLPWIVTNPFYIGVHGEKKESKKLVKLNSTPIILNQKLVKVEKNQSSSGNILFYPKTKTYVLNYKIKKDKDNRNFWVSLSYRKNFDFSKYKSISFFTRSEKEMRYWLELRTGNETNGLWFRHSFISKPHWTFVSIPFKNFFCINRKNYKAGIDLSKISSLFFSINNSILFLDVISGSIHLNSFSLQK